MSYPLHVRRAAAALLLTVAVFGPGVTNATVKPPLAATNGFDWNG